MKDFKQLAKNVIDIEQQAVVGLHRFIDDNFEQACQLMYHAAIVTEVLQTNTAMVNIVSAVAAGRTALF